MILNKKENPKHYKVFTSFIDSKKENVNKNNPQNETIFRSISGLDTSNVHKHERILGQMKKKTPTRYKTRNPFNFEAFTQKRRSNEYINQKLIEDEELTKSKNEKDYYHEFLKEQMRTEAKSREKLMETYQRIILLKLKREKYEKILDDTYHLTDNALKILLAFLLAPMTYCALLTKKRRKWTFFFQKAERIITHGLIAPKSHESFVAIFLILLRAFRIFY